MKIEFNYYWGLLGILGLLGYVLENPLYYIFFAFSLLFLIPVYNKNVENGKTEETKPNAEQDYNSYRIIMWIGSALLIISSLALIIWKTMNDVVVIGLLLGIMFYVISFFAYIGMGDTVKDERLRKIGTLAATWSWYITLTFVGSLVVTMYWANRIHDPVELMGVTIFVMVTAMLVAHVILSRKGDID